MKKLLFFLSSLLWMVFPACKSQKTQQEATAKPQQNSPLPQRGKTGAAKVVSPGKLPEPRKEDSGMQVIPAPLEPDSSRKEN